MVEASARRREQVPMLRPRNIRAGPFGPTGPVAHLIAQNAYHQTDTNSPDRHTSLNQRALAVQADVSDRFLCPGGPKVLSSTLGSPKSKPEVHAERDPNDPYIGWVVDMLDG